MKKYIRSLGIKTLVTFCLLAFFQLASWAQDKTVEVTTTNTTDANGWLQNNWIWVVGGVVLLIVIIILATRGGGSSRRTETTISNNRTGTVTRSSETDVN